MLNFFIMISVLTSILFLAMKHPLSMGFMLIIQTIMISIITGMLINNFWFSYILLITMLSGALVLFIYMASVASNEKFFSSIKIMMFSTFMILMYMITSFIMEMNEESWMSVKNESLMNDQMLSLLKLFNLHNLTVTIMIISYLFITMIVISYIVNVFEGPLRAKN
uniref:NADH-ubiquinone oxidoreductase chain 6 n=1 Tax=Agriosphodrus dohrni TaxID=184613 RepID=G0WK43_AGRDO|nr:NADH dehydrogenase subunit 6 [Agriosphodrus dohrni]ADF65641.1 NADH dehydrogenase subunit 6 [Agriosphodrus dohrni]